MTRNGGATGATVLVVGLGDHGSRVLGAFSRSERIARLVGAGRDAARGTALTRQAALVAELQGGPPRIEFELLDVRQIEAAVSLLRRVDPDVVVMAASRYTWWRVLGHPALRRLPYAAWLPLQLSLVHAIMAARNEAGVRAPVVCIPYPDAVGPALAPLGLAPEIGAGNVTKTAAKLALLAAEAVGAGRSEVEVRLVMHHAAQRFAFPIFAEIAGVGRDAVAEPPWSAEVRVRGELLVEERVAELFRADYPLPPDRESQDLTSAATVRVVEALLSDTPTLEHAPAPGGRPGGYPLRVLRGSIELDLPAELDEASAIAINERAARWDGIERIEPDGTIVFTEAVIVGSEGILGLRLERVVPSDRNAVADELEARICRLLES